MVERLGYDRGYDTTLKDKLLRKHKVKRVYNLIYKLTSTEKHKKWYVSNHLEKSTTKINNSLRKLGLNFLAVNKINTGALLIINSLIK